MENKVAEKISASIEYIQNDVDHYVKRKEAVQEFLREKGYEAVVFIPKLNEFLKPFGLEIEEIHSIYKTGMDRYDNVEEHDQLKVELRLKMIGRRKPFKQMDYPYISKGINEGSTPGGVKARAYVYGITDAFYEKYGREKYGFEINHFCLDKTNRILAGFWIK